MTRQEVLYKLRNEISDAEFNCIKKGSLKEISAANRKLIVELMEEDTVCLDQAEMAEQEVERLRTITYDYLAQYYAECPPAWKWIFLSCAYVAFVNLKPMHAEEWVHYETDIVGGEIRYYCPAKSREADTNCSFCVCHYMDEKNRTIAQ